MSGERPASGTPRATYDVVPTAQAPTGLEEQLRDELAPRLEVLRLLGRGSMASVFLAREAALRRLVAVKVLSPELARDHVTRQRFEREGQAAASLSHPNVAAVYRVDRLTSDVPYLVMQYVKGRSLAQLLRSGPGFDEPAARRIITELASALASAHRRGIMHRDVRPDNVVIEEETGRVMLLDFGLAGILESGDEMPSNLTRAGDVLGDPRYASPEMLAGRKVTEVADVYSLGVLAHELLTGHKPDEAAEERGVATRLAQLRPGIDAELEAIVHACLAGVPEERPTAADVAKRLQTPVAAPSSPPERRPEAVDVGFDVGPAESLMRLTLLGEMKRRRVFRVAIFYLIYAWLAIQVSDSVLPALGLPDWTVTLVVVVVIAGFPIALVLGWIFDITPDGVKRTQRR
jgi:serine/threonine protein kinase